LGFEQAYSVSFAMFCGLFFSDISNYVHWRNGIEDSIFFGCSESRFSVLASSFSFTSIQVAEEARAIMEKNDFKELRRVLFKHKEINQANRNSLLIISSKVAELEQASIMQNFKSPSEELNRFTRD
jgi:hypothetical protein